jgi:glycosyltransferase involved in cell wall biosynthesis
VKVLVVTSMYPPHHYGGYELMCHDAVAAFEAAGHEVLVLTSDVTVPGVEAPVEDRRRVRRDLRLYWRDHEIVRPGLGEVVRLERANQRTLAAAIADHHPDVVSFWAMGSVSLGLIETCRRRGLPSAFVVCDDWLAYGPQVDRWTRIGRRGGRGWRRLTAAAGLPSGPDDLGAAGAWCFISGWTRRRAEEHGAWSAARATLGYSGVDLDALAPPPNDAPPRPWSGRLLCVGRLDERKGVDVAVRALAALPGCVLHVVGRGDDEHRVELRRLATELGVADRLSFAVATRAELAAIYRAADVLLFPPRWEEPFGMVPLEAMACGTPVVATATGGSGEYLLDGRNCLRVAVDDAAALEGAVRRLADDGELRAALVRGGLLTADAFDVRRYHDLVLALHRAAVDGSPLPTRPPIDEVLAAVGRGRGSTARRAGRCCSRPEPRRHPGGDRLRHRWPRRPRGGRPPDRGPGRRRVLSPRTDRARGPAAVRASPVRRPSAPRP